MLPESLGFLIARGRHAKAAALARKLGIAAVELEQRVKDPLPKPTVGAVFREVFSKQNALATISLWVAQVAAVIVSYGLGTCLAQLKRSVADDLWPILSSL